VAGCTRFFPALVAALWSIDLFENALNLIKISSEVFTAPGPIASIGCEEIEFLRREVARNAKGRVRINIHPEDADSLHEMFIAIRPDSYIRPHKHPNKSEAFHVVHGEVDIVVFEDDGSVREIVRLAAGGGGKAFYYRMSKPYFHTLVIRSDMLIVHEITNGPFVRDGTVYAAFAPREEDDLSAIRAWQKGLSDRVGRIA
jgi:cupin fold WbuC family metalloprotein